MAAIQDLVLTFCPKMHFTQQRRLKLLMPVFVHIIVLAQRPKPAEAHLNCPRGRAIRRTKFVLG